MDFATLAPVLNAIGLADAARDLLTRASCEELAQESGVSVAAFRLGCRFAHDCGLAHIPLSPEPRRVSLLGPGRQYLARRGEVDSAAISFLPFTVPDLHARSALLRGGRQLVSEFRKAMVTGRGVNHARLLVPLEFARALDERAALDLFAAAVALMARLESEEPAACVAEELLAIELVAHADVILEGDAAGGWITPGEASDARNALPTLFGLFRQVDEPSTLPERIDRWFRPFAGSLPAGYLVADPV